MPLPDKCPKCGEKATNDKGQCVFCGTQVVQPQAILTEEQKEKAAANYKFASWSFFVLGIAYFVGGIVASIAFRAPLLGLLVTGVISGVHGGLLLQKNEWVQSYTKQICIARMCLFFWILTFLVPALPFLMAPGLIMLAIITYDLCCLLMMIKTIDDVYFG